MSKPTTRQGLIDYSLRKLGYPVLEINVDDDQIDDLSTSNRLLIEYVCVYYILLLVV